MDRHHGDDLLDPMWYQHADGKHYISGGRLNGADPILIMQKRDPVSKKNMLMIKCAGTDGEFVRTQAFSGGSLCSHCLARGGFAVLPSIQEHDITKGNDDIWWGPPRVPTGCPHTADNGSPECDRVPSRTIKLSDKHAEISPHSWRLFSDNGKVTLTIQYRQRFYNQETGKHAEKSLYRNICADLRSGRSYVSDRSDPNRKYRKASGSPIEDMTYTGYSTYTAYSPYAERNQLQAAFEEMYVAVCNEMERLGYEPVAYKGTDASINSSLSLINIASSNRFPRLGFIPLVNIRHMLPERYRKMVNKLPRDVELRGLFPGLAIPFSEKLLEIAGGDPSVIDFLFLLSKIGCDDADALAYACDPERSKKIVRKIAMCTAFEPEYGAKGLDIAPMFFAKMMPSSGWKGLFDVLAQMSDGKAETLFGLTATLIYRSSALPWYDEEHPEEERRVSQRRELPDVPSYEWSSRAFGEKWKFTQQVSHFHNSHYTTSVAPTIMITLSRGDEELAQIGLSGKPRLDRRKWPDKVNREYYEKVILYQQSHLEAPSSEKTEKLLKEIDALEKRLLSAYSYEYRLGQIRQCDNQSHSCDVPEAKVILRWADKFSLPTDEIHNDSTFCDERKAYEQGKAKRKRETARKRKSLV